MDDLDEYHRLVAYGRAHGLDETQAHATAEEIMEEAICDRHVTIREEGGHNENVYPWAHRR